MKSFADAELSREWLRGFQLVSTPRLEWVLWTSFGSTLQLHSHQGAFHGCCVECEGKKKARYRLAQEKINCCSVWEILKSRMGERKWREACKSFQSRQKITSFEPLPMRFHQLVPFWRWTCSRMKAKILVASHKHTLQTLMSVQTTKYLHDSMKSPTSATILSSWPSYMCIAIGGKTNTKRPFVLFLWVEWGEPLPQLHLPETNSIHPHSFSIFVRDNKWNWILR